MLTKNNSFHPRDQKLSRYLYRYNSLAQRIGYTYLPPVDLRAVCLVRAILFELNEWEKDKKFPVQSAHGSYGSEKFSRSKYGHSGDRK